jgi:ubiquinone/menaquinone biosynthesis C-methylase UbiE
LDIRTRVRRRLPGAIYRLLITIYEGLEQMYSGLAIVFALLWFGSRLPEVEDHPNKKHTAAGLYWGEHTVGTRVFIRPKDSVAWLEHRFENYPLFKEFTALYGSHDDEVILDYGCGPGNDVTGFAIYTRARKIMGMDVSGKALDLTRIRLAVHKVNKGRIRLYQISDLDPKIPLGDQVIDHVNCQGVLHHTSDPQGILSEFYRVMRTGATACIMMYNRDSIWYNLYTAYERMIVRGEFAGDSLAEAFRKNTDGPNCPIANCYDSAQIVALCKSAGFDRIEYMGGYLSQEELRCLRTYGEEAAQDGKLALQQRQFLKALTYDEHQYPMFHGKHAGIGGVYWLSK